jgi:hypothetical protein
MRSKERWKNEAWRKGQVTSGTLGRKGSSLVRCLPELLFLFLSVWKLHLL